MFVLLFRVFGVGLRFFTAIFLSELIGFSELGDYLIILQTLTMLSIFALLGGDQLILSKFPNLFLKKNILKLKNLSYSIFVILSFSYIISSFIYFLFLLSQDKFSLEISFFYTLTISFVLLFFIIIQYLLTPLLRSENKHTLSQFLEQVLQPITFFSILLFYKYNFNNTLDFNYALTALTLSYIFTFSVFIYKTTELIYDLKLIKIYRRSKVVFLKLLSLSGFVLSFNLYIRLPLLLIGVYLPSTDVSNYYLASRFAEFVEFPLGIASVIFAHKISIKINDDNFIAYQNRINTFVFLCTFFVSLVLFYNWRSYSNYAKIDNSDAHYVFMILSLAYLIGSYFGFIEFIYIAKSCLRKLTIVVLLNVLIMLIACFLIGRDLSLLIIASLYAAIWVFFKFYLSYTMFGMRIFKFDISLRSINSILRECK
jgi:O-antigen/teichoic acid export membrane protein